MQRLFRLIGRLQVGGEASPELHQLAHSKGNLPSCEDGPCIAGRHNPEARQYGK